MSRITEQRITSLQGTGKRQELRDDDPRGLSLVVSANGERRRWAYRPHTRLEDGTRPRITLGHHPSEHGRDSRCPDCLTVREARSKALELRSQIAKGELPHRKPKGPEKGTTLDAVAARYLEWAAGHLADATMYENTRILKRDVLSAIVSGRRLGSIDVREIDPPLVAEMVARVKTRPRAKWASKNCGPMASHAKTKLSAVMSYAMKHEYLITWNPCRAIAHPHRAEPRDRVLSHLEIEQQWRVCLDGLAEGDETAALIPLALLTMQRRRPILCMEWSQIEDDGVWCIPVEVKDGKKRIRCAKSGYPHWIPLSPMAQEVLGRLAKITGGARWVFPSPKDLSRPRSTLWTTFNRYRSAAGVDHYTYHDLRATGATIMAEYGVEESIIELAMDHKPKTMAGRVYIRDKRRRLPVLGRALRLLGTRISDIAAGATGGGDVVPIRGQR